MPKFTYSAIDSSTGKDKKGMIEAVSQEQAAIDLKAQGLLPTQIMAEGDASGLRVGTKKAAPARPGGGDATSTPFHQTPRKKKGAGGITFGRVINNQGLAVFTRQLSTLVNAGMPILRSLETLGRQEKNLPF